jgi:putative ABC transport system ATP-binding protein
MFTMTATATRIAAAAAVEHATKVYGSGENAVRALDDVSLDVPASRFTAIMGRSGSGKSTLLHCMAGLDDLTTGRAFIAGRDLSELTDHDLTALRRDRIGFVFQAFNLLPMLSAAENIRLPFTLGNRSVDDAWFDRVVETVGLADRLQHRPVELSGGEQQRVAVARALVTRPEVVFADEPTGNLDTHSGTELLSFLGAVVREFDQTVAMVTHDPAAAAQADRVIFLSDGRVVDDLDEPTAQKVTEFLAALEG